jgi:hypothetical protein
MKSQRRLKIALVFLVLACGLTGFRWWQLARIHESIEHERARLGEDSRVLEQRTAETQSRVEIADTQPSEEQVAEARDRAADQRRQAPLDQLVAELKHERGVQTTTRPPPPPEGPGGNVFNELMGDPEYVRLAMTLWRDAIVLSQARRFRWAGIPVEKRRALSGLILEVGFSGDDAARASAQLGGSEQDAWRARQSAMARVDREIRDLLGEETYARLQRANMASGADSLIESLETRLSYSGSPLTAAQAERVFAAAVDARVGFMLQPGQLEDLVERARPVLNAEQLAAFRDVAGEFNLGKSQSSRPASTAPR